MFSIVGKCKLCFWFNSPSRKSREQTEKDQSLWQRRNLPSCSPQRSTSQAVRLRTGYRFDPIRHSDCCLTSHYTVDLSYFANLWSVLLNACWAHIRCSYVDYYVTCLITGDLSASGCYCSRQSRQQCCGHHHMGLCIFWASKCEVLLLIFPFYIQYCSFSAVTSVWKPRHTICASYSRLHPWTGIQQGLT